MKNGIRKITAIGLGVCLWALCFVFLFFVVTKPYTEKRVIWLPDNYELENDVKNNVVSIMPSPIDDWHQSDKVFYSEIDIESFKKLFGGKRVVSVKIVDKGYFGPNRYQIAYQTQFDCADKSFIIVANEYYRYNKRTLSEMRLRDRELFLENKRDKSTMFFFSIVAFVVIAVFVCLLGLDIPSKQRND